MNWRDSPRLHSETTQAVPFQRLDNLRPANPATNCATLEPHLTCVIGKRARERSIAAMFDGAETHKMPAVVTPSICNPATT